MAGRICNVGLSCERKRCVAHNQITFPSLKPIIAAKDGVAGQGSKASSIWGADEDAGYGGQQAMMGPALGAGAGAMAEPAAGASGGPSFIGAVAGANAAGTGAVQAYAGSSGASGTGL